MTTKSMFLGALLAFNLTPALAQSSNAINISGTVSRVDDTSVAITIDSGAVESYALAPKLVVLQNKSASLADIKPNDFVASAAVPHEDGKLHSTELRIFPEALRGLGEGQRPMNDARGQTMTNATVTGAVIAGGSNTIKVKFAGGESELVLDPGVPVTRIDAADKSMVTNGVQIRAQGVRGADGPVITRITILKGAD
ncbi:hypothetical protein PY365_00965 [Roseiarcaceae bacterium H3SJ34-1]|uniref:hypothetical protein n=1 Tax=Terripilifer ovatus TaxID=3032367 RepID=UPI003AB9624B|nr:hypothetical protein [Roseiarcaceae bacterium H3SJ34-1]